MDIYTSQVTRALTLDKRIPARLTLTRSLLNVCDSYQQMN